MNDERFIPIQVLSQQDLIPIAAPILNIVQSGGEELTVDSKFFPLCPIEVAIKGTFYTHDHAATSKSIGQSIVDSSTRNTSNLLSAFLEEDLYCTPLSFVSEENVFNRASSPALNARKKMTKAFSGCWDINLSKRREITSS